MTLRTKDELLTHYATREAKRFVQIDCWRHKWCGENGFLPEDEDGDILAATITT